MTDLTDFLLARIAEDEERARASIPGPWRRDHDDISSYAETDEDGKPTISVVITDSGAYPPDFHTGEHIIAWQPARVLAECEAKRRIVEKAHEILDREVVNNDEAWVAEFMLAQLALPYADHPDYRPEFRP